jgi:menaquinone-dependent protoporphyrinogen IX oxidase
METSSAGSAGKVLVVYYSLTGNTARVARDIARRTGGDIESLRDSSYGVGFTGYIKAAVDAVRGASVQLGPLARNPRDYALTIIGTPVWVGHMTPSVRGWLQRCRADLGPVAFFVTSGDTDVSKIAPALESLAGRKAVALAGFNAKVLGNREFYDAEISGFLNAINRAAPPLALDLGKTAAAR